VEKFKEIEKNLPNHPQILQAIISRPIEELVPIG
jgi:hypothetical protein